MGDQNRPSTSENARMRGRPLPMNSTVRRRLFESDGEIFPSKPHDYLSSIIKREYEARNLRNELILKGMKWNFDFEREAALPGPIEWYRKASGDEWVGMKPTGRIDNMRKRKIEDIAKSSYADERSKVRKLSVNHIQRRRSFFNDERAADCASMHAADDNFINKRVEDTSPQYKEDVHYWNFDFNSRTPLNGPVSWKQVGDDWVGSVEGLDSRIILYPNTQVQNDPSAKEEDDNVETISINISDHIKVVYGDWRLAVEMPGDYGISEIQNLQNLAIADRGDMKVHILRKKELKQLIDAKNQATPKNMNKESMPPALKAKSSTTQVSGQRIRRKINFN